jgi:YD repeat-containing protein
LAPCRGGEDELSKLVRVRDAGGGEHTFVYDMARNLVAKQDANGSLTTYEYDALNLRSAEVQHLDAHARLSPWSRSVPTDRGIPDPIAGSGALVWTTTYDANGAVETVTDPKRQVVTQVHGVLDRLASSTWSNHAYPLPATPPFNLRVPALLL